VHDELVLEVAPGEREVVSALVRDEMQQAYPLAVTLDISVGFGRTWHDAAH
jgi:DNA polymerase-1